MTTSTSNTRVTEFCDSILILDCVTVEYKPMPALNFLLAASR